MTARRRHSLSPAKKRESHAPERSPASAWQLQTAKAKFSEVFRLARAQGAQVVTRGGADAVVVIPLEEYQTLLARSHQPKSLVEFFRRSPLAGIDLSIARDPDTGREVEL